MQSKNGTRFVYAKTSRKSVFLGNSAVNILKSNATAKQSVSNYGYKIVINRLRTGAMISNLTKWIVTALALYIALWQVVIGRGSAKDNTIISGHYQASALC